MDFYSVLDFINGEDIPPTDRFAHITMAVTLRWVKEQFPGRKIDEIGYDELIQVFTEYQRARGKNG